MDRKWVYAPRTSLEYENGVNEFLEFASKHDPDSNGKFLCPCVNCLNERRLSADQIREHVVCNGFNKGYTKWIWHGEFEMPSRPKNEEVDEDMYDRVEKMINDIGAEVFEQVYTSGVCETLSTNAEKPLYKDCENFSRLSAVLKLITLKAANGWSDKSFTELLGL
ncbi:Unknown protein [Striga hermonthica]|uniref:Transposase-associated domain-containing protein n=1 Tax=Striga hermonthica TaxID=68872 RepID=A0A9N7NPX3_STRHE|nr:Unknown protein [Striga hermonthica]